MFNYSACKSNKNDGYQVFQEKLSIMCTCVTFMTTYNNGIGEVLGGEITNINLESKWLNIVFQRNDFTRVIYSAGKL